MTDESLYGSCTNRSGSGSPGRSPTRSPSRDQGLVTLPPCTDVTSQTFQIEEQLNALFEKRLHEINEEANGDASLKERTYKEWIAMLRDINKTFINNIHEIENEAAERLALLQRRAGTNCRYSQDSELCKCRKDMAALIELVRNGRQYGDWNVDKFKFETITERDIFGDGAFSNILMRDDVRNDCNKPSSNADPKSCASQKSKLVANVKALAYEVADKHDEIRELKKQILSMEDEIQKAQKKIQLKDDVIRELRSDLKSLPKCNQVCGPRILDRTTSNIGCAEMCGTEGSSTPRAGSVYSNRGSMDMAFGLNIGDDEDDGEDYVMRLKDELNQFFETKQVYDQNIEEQGRELKEQQDRLSDMVDKLLKKTNCFQLRLRFYRHELLNLEIPKTTSTFTFSSDKDSGINSTDSDTDQKIVSSVRNRIACLNEEKTRLKNEEKCLQIKYEDANSKYLAKSMLLEKTSQTLREVVDTLSQAISSPIMYDIIFSEKTSSTKNPIVEALDVLIKSSREKDVTINELRKQISSTGHVNEELELDCQNLKSELCNLRQSV